MYINGILSKALLLANTLTTAVAASVPSVSLSTREFPEYPSHCPPFQGTFVIDQYKLYPENADWDLKSCLLYIGCLYNATLCVYDPYKAEIVDIFYFNGISLHPETRLGGVGVDQETGLVAIAANNAITFDSLGQNISGTNYFLQFDPKTRSVLYELNLTTAVNGKYSGYQDVEQDPHGNIYVSGTFPSSILKVKADGSKVTPWYLSTPYNHTIPGLSGLAAYGWLLLGFDRTAEQLVKFDMRQKTGTPIVVPQHPFGNISTSDAIYLPPRYNATVLLVARNDLGLAVLRSKDAKWNSAEYLGVVLNTDNTSYTTGAVQIGDGVYIITDFVGFATTPGSNSGNKTSFTWTDITEKIDELLLA